MSDKGLYRLAIADLKMAKFAVSTNDEVVLNMAAYHTEVFDCKNSDFHHKSMQ